jgi:hypothetical protein
MVMGGFKDEGVWKALDVPESEKPVYIIRWAGCQMKKCHKCLKDLEIKTPVGRKDVCPSCGSDLRCCLNCGFHAQGTYNECRESQAERVTEKERNNFCDYFVFRDAASGHQRKDAAGDSAKAKLSSLFK